RVALSPVCSVLKLVLNVRTFRSLKPDGVLNKLQKLVKSNPAPASKINESATSPTTKALWYGFRAAAICAGLETRASPGPARLACSIGTNANRTEHPTTSNEAKMKPAVPKE